MPDMQDVNRSRSKREQYAIDAASPAEMQFPQFDAEFRRLRGQWASQRLHFERVDLGHELGKPTAAGGRRLTLGKPQNILRVPQRFWRQSDLVFHVIWPVMGCRISSPV